MGCPGGPPLRAQAPHKVCIAFASLGQARPSCSVSRARAIRDFLIEQASCRGCRGRSWARQQSLERCDERSATHGLLQHGCPIGTICRISRASDQSDVLAELWVDSSQLVGEGVARDVGYAQIEHSEIEAALT